MSKLSQFEKRKAKSLDEIAKDIESKRSEIRASAEPTFTQSAYDIFSEGAKYKVAEIAYDPVSGAARVVEIYEISRLIALQYRNQKSALGALKKLAKKKE